MLLLPTCVSQVTASGANMSRVQLQNFGSMLYTSANAIRLQGGSNIINQQNGTLRFTSSEENRLIGVNACNLDNFGNLIVESPVFR